MKTIYEATREILLSSPLALDALQAGWLNMSAFADSIRYQVEAHTMKSVSRSTIVVSLSRLVPELQQLPPLIPNVVLYDLSIKLPLCEITYDKTAALVEQVERLPHHVVMNSERFFTTTSGIREVTIVTSQEYLEAIQKFLKIKPKFVFRDLVGLTVRFDEQYLHVPNVMYAILARLATKRINLTEIISTASELTIIVEQKYTDVASTVLQQLLRNESE